MEKTSKEMKKREVLTYITSMVLGTPPPEQLVNEYKAVLMPLWKRARRDSGLARFEREAMCRRIKNRRVKSWRIPGSYEASTYSDLFGDTVEAFLIEFERERILDEERSEAHEDICRKQLS